MAYYAVLELYGLDEGKWVKLRPARTHITAFRWRIWRGIAEDFTVTKRVDGSSPLLFERCCDGDTIPTARLTLFRGGSGATPFAMFRFQNVMITSIRWSGMAGDPGEDSPVECCSFCSEACEIVCTSPGAPGVLGVALWDCRVSGWD